MDKPLLLYLRVFRRLSEKHTTFAHVIYYYCGENKDNNLGWIQLWIQPLIFSFQKYYRTVIFLFLQDSNGGNCWGPCPLDPWWKPWPFSLSLEFFISLSLKPFGLWSGKIFSAPKVRERQWGKSAVKKSASKWVPTKLDWNWPNVSGLCNTLFNEKEDCPLSTTCYLTRTW